MQTMDRDLHMDNTKDTRGHRTNTLMVAHNMGSTCIHRSSIPTNSGKDLLPDGDLLFRIIITRLPTIRLRILA